VLTVFLLVIPSGIAQHAVSCVITVHQFINFEGEEKDMSSTNLNQFTQEFQQAVIEALYNPKLLEICKKYGLMEGNVLKFQCMLDLKNVQSDDATVVQEIKNALQAIPGDELVMVDCVWCSGGCC
jgi:hypothetical protein